MAKKDSAVMEPPKPHHAHDERHHEESQAEVEGQAAPEEEEPSGEMKGAQPKTPVVQPLAVPPPLGKTPTNWTQLLPATMGERATHHFGPVVSGGAPGSGTVRYAMGSALCALFLQLDTSMGNFTLPIQFPGDSVILWASSVTFTAFTGGTGASTFQLGRTSGGAEILAATGMDAVHAVAITPAAGTLPLETDAPGMTPYQAYLTVAQLGNTAGQGFLAIVFARMFQKWS